MDRCGNVAAILQLDESLGKTFPIFEAAPQVYLNISIVSILLFSILNNILLYCTRVHNVIFNP